MIRSAVSSNVPDTSDATDVVRASENDSFLFNVSDSKAVNVYPTLANAPTQVDIIALLTHSGAHNVTWSGEWGQAHKHSIISRLDLSTLGWTEKNISIQSAHWLMPSTL